MQAAASAATAARFLGWRVVGAGFVSQLLNTSCTFGAFGVFMTPLIQEFGTNRAVLSLGPAIAMVGLAPLGVLIGRVVDRGPVRQMMLLGVLLCAGGLLLLSRARALWQLGLIFCALVTGGAALFGPQATMALVGKWFVRRRGIALGLAVAGSTLATAAAPAAAAWLIDHLGWREAAVGFGLLALGLGLPTFALCVVRSPEDVGQHPDGAAVPPPEVATPATGEIGPLFRDPNFYLGALGFSLLFTSPIVNAIHFVPFAEDLGMTRQLAAAPQSALAVWSLIGKLVFGVLGDRVDPRRALALAVAILVGAWAVLLSEPGFAGLLLAGSLMGLGIGAVIPLQGVVIGRCFGRNGMGQVFGIGGLLGLPIVAGSAPIVGAIFVRSGSYRLAFSIEATALALAGVLLSLLRFPPLSTTASAAEASPRLSPP